MIITKKIKRINCISSPEFIFGFIDSNALFLITVTIKTVREENIDDTDEYLNIRDTTNQVNINNKLS